ncbi:DNA-processing protein DprA [Spiroplasma corruscae]|uniref:DNA-processing protein DprA n=1 Tax=Spiroplasma corruscae TaxID=216934 RepID=UPI0012FE3344|nr:hypothetical protein [Spiroplasma corruscae]
MLLYFSLKYNGDWDKIFDALEQKEKIDINELRNIQDKIRCKFITLLNPIYPTELKNTFKPPFVLYYVGNIQLLSNFNKTLSIYSNDKLDKKNINSINCILNESKENDYTIILSNDDNYIKKVTIENLDVNNKYIYAINGSIYNYFVDNDLDFEDNFSKTLFLSYTYKNDHESNDAKTNHLQASLSKFVLFLDCINTQKYINLFNHFINEGKEVLSIPEIELSSAITNTFIDMGTKILKNFK